MTLSPSSPVDLETAMVSPYYNKVKENIKKHKYRLYSLAEAVVLFAVLVILTLLVGGKSICPIYNLFHIKCMGCGMTRAFMAISRFDFSTAWDYNVMAIPLFLGIVIYCGLLAVDIFSGKGLTEKFEKILFNKYICIVYIFIFLLHILLKVI